jgi:3-isopropylmalate/(R)-2-methylmalate dehydratase small subunit
VWALQNYGFEAVLSNRFADIFRNNSLKGGLLTVILPQEVIEELWKLIESDPASEITVDLEAREVRFAGKKVSFELDDYTRWRLMEGLDDIGLTLRNVDAIATYEEKRPSFKAKTLPVRS